MIERQPVVTSLDPQEFAEGVVTKGPMSTNTVWSKYADGRSYASQRPAVEIIGMASERGKPGKGRGIVYWDKVAGEASNGVYFVNNDTVYAGSYDNPLTATITAGRDPIHFVEAGNYLVIVDVENNQAWYLDSAAPEQMFQINDINFPGINSNAQLAGGGTELDGFLFVMDTDGRIYNSDLNDVTSWNALGFLDAQREQDAGVFLTKHHDHVCAIGSNSIEFFYNAGNPTGSPLARRPDVSYRTGALDFRNVFSSGERIYFIGSEKIGTPGVYQISGFELTRISTDSIDRFIAKTRVTDAYKFNMTGGYIGEHYFTFINTLAPASSEAQISTAAAAVRDFSSMSLVNSLNPTGQIREVYFKPDGTRMYLMIQASTVHEFTLSTAWDLSTAVATGTTFAAVSDGYGFTMKPDGTRFWVTQSSGAREVHSYTMSTAWDLSTASYDSVSFDPSLSALVAIQFKTDGTKMYLYDGTVHQFSLSTAWDITTATADSKTLVITGGDDNIAFSSDGLELYNSNDATTSDQRLSRYTLTTAWDISTAGAAELLATGEDAAGAPTYRGNGTGGLFIAANIGYIYSCDNFGWVDQYDYVLTGAVATAFEASTGTNYEPKYTFYFDATHGLWGDFETSVASVDKFAMSGISERSAILRGESIILFMSGDLGVFNMTGSVLDTSGEDGYVVDGFISPSNDAYVAGGISGDSTNIDLSITTNEMDFGSLTNKFMYRFSLAGNTVGSESDASAPIRISWTDDVYKTFSTPKFYDAGNRRSLVSLGQFKRRAFKLEYSGEDRLRLEQMEMDVEGSDFA